MAAMDVVAKTGSLCPQCLAKIAARIVTDDEQVYLEKECPHHGHYKTVIWRGAGHYLDWYRPPGPAKEPLRLTSISRGCPYYCGISRRSLSRAINRRRTHPLGSFVPPGCEDSKKVSRAKKLILDRRPQSQGSPLAIR